jgi:hypothetical protein
MEFSSRSQSATRMKSPIRVEEKLLLSRQEAAQVLLIAEGMPRLRRR